MAERPKADGNGDAGAPPAAALDNAAKRDGSATPIAAERRSADGAQAAGSEHKPGKQAKPGKGSTATATRPVVGKTAEKATVSETKGRAALTAAGRGVRRARNLIASIVWLTAVLCAAILALGALFTALSQTNERNEIVQWVLARGEDLVGPFGDLFKLETAKNTVLVNWSIAAVAYLVVGKIGERIIRP